jgi:hypothetical protein
MVRTAKKNKQLYVSCSRINFYFHLLYPWWEFKQEKQKFESFCPNSLLFHFFNIFFLSKILAFSCRKKSFTYETYKFLQTLTSRSHEINRLLKCVSFSYCVHTSSVHGTIWLCNVRTCNIWNESKIKKMSLLSTQLMGWRTQSKLCPPPTFIKHIKLPLPFQLPTPSILVHTEYTVNLWS